MTNAEKFKTAEERAKAFDRWCHTRGGCHNCVLIDKGIEFATQVCSLYWIDLEAEEDEPLPCPFCGGSVVVGHKTNIHGEKFRQVWCKDEERCGYECSAKKTETEAIAVHNHMVRAVTEDVNGPRGL